MNRPLQDTDCRPDPAMVRRGISQRVNGDYLLLAAPVNSPAQIENLLRFNETPRHRWRAVLGTGGVPQLRAELMFGEDESMGFSSARDALMNGPATRANGAPHLTNEELENACRDAGWEFLARRGGGGSVSLTGAPPEGSVATLVSNGAGLLISMDFETIDAPVPVTLRAAGWLLLRAASMVRFARPLMLRGDEGAFTPRFEILFSHTPTPALLGSALGALTLVAQLCAAECAALGSETIAREFLARLEDRKGFQPPTRNHTGGHTA